MCFLLHGGRAENGSVVYAYNVPVNGVKALTLVLYNIMRSVTLVHNLVILVLLLTFPLMWNKLLASVVNKRISKGRNIWFLA